MEMKRSGGDAIVVGGGAIGCATARALAREGVSVVIVEPEGTDAGATWAAAGMLAPLGEADEPGAFLELGLQSLALYPDFVAAIEEESGMAVDLQRSGKLQVAFSDEEAAALRAREAWARGVSPDVEWLDRQALLELEPQLSPHALAALRIPRDWQVDNRRLGAALRVAAERAGARVRTGTVQRILSEGGLTTGVELDGGERLSAPRVILAAGCWSGRIEGLPRALPLRPVRGQMLALDARQFPVTHMIATRDVYLVPRADGRLLVGATVEEAGWRAETTAGGIRGLLDAALRTAPGLERAPLLEVWAGLRPGTPDDLPILGEDPALPGLYYATGHYRNGILLTPITAAAMAGMVLGKPARIDREAFRPDRFVRP